MRWKVRMGTEALPDHIHTWYMHIHTNTHVNMLTL